MAKKGRPTRYFTPTEFEVLKALFRQGIPQVHALAEIKWTPPAFHRRRAEAEADAELPQKELPFKRRQNVQFIFELLKARREHAQTLVSRLNLDDGRNVRWLLATLYPDVYSQRVSEDRTIKDDVIRDYDEPSEAQEQASELLAEGDKPDVPGLDD